MPTPRSQRRPAALIGLVALLLVMASGASVVASPGQAGASGVQAPPPPGQRPPSAWAVADIDAGVILAGEDAHRPVPPASTIKLLTALVVRDQLAPDARIEVSPLAATRPARKLYLRAGERWRVSNLLRAMLLCSCNDVAYALAEAAGGGDFHRFVGLFYEKAAELGLGDAPVLGDPAGLDDTGGYQGGNRISAADLAIVGGAVLDDPVLSRIVAREEFRWRGGDGERHVVYGHNRLIGSYPGATGLKTGYTDKAGATLVASAERDGRRIVAVLLDSPNMWAQSPWLLDVGFDTSPAAAQGPLRAGDAQASASSAGTPETATPETATPESATPESATPTSVAGQGDSVATEQGGPAPRPGQRSESGGGAPGLLRLGVLAPASLAVAGLLVVVVAARVRSNWRTAA